MTEDYVSACVFCDSCNNLLCKTGRRNEKWYKKWEYKFYEIILPRES